MDKKINFKRILLLIQRYLLENISRELMFWSIIALIFTVLDHRVFVLFVLFSSGLIYSVRLQKDLLRGPNGMHYLMIPATQTEKIISNIFLNTFYHFSMTLLAYSIGNLLVTLTYHIILKLKIPVSWDLFQVSNTVYADGFMQVTHQNVFWQIFGIFAFSQAIFTLGTLYFKNNAVIKTVFSIVIIGMILFFIQIILFKTIWDIKHLSNAIFPMFVMISDSTIPAIADKAITVGSYLLLPLLWIVSYFRLTEKQV
jgi:hypothetical protein